ESEAAKLVVGSLYYLRDGESAAAMSRMGSNKRADIVRRQLDQAAAIEKQGFLASCQLVGTLVATAMPGQASDHDRAEWTAVVEAAIAVAASCRSLEELEARIA